MSLGSDLSCFVCLIRLPSSSRLPEANITIFLDVLDVVLSVIMTTILIVWFPHKLDL